MILVGCFFDGTHDGLTRLTCLKCVPPETGADERSRTSDLRITNALLYQLSYIGEYEILAENAATCIQAELNVRFLRGKVIGVLSISDTPFGVQTGSKTTRDHSTSLVDGSSQA